MISTQYFDFDDGDLYCLHRVDRVVEHEGRTIAVWRDEDGCLLFYNITEYYGGEILGIFEGWVYDTFPSSAHCDDGWTAQDIVDYTLSCCMSGNYRFRANITIPEFLV